MKRKWRVYLVSSVLIIVNIIGSAVITAPVVAVGEKTAFYSSFETSDPISLMHSTVDSDGLRGRGVGAPRIPGDFMKMLTTVEGSSTVTGGEGMGSLADNNPNTKWCTTPNWNNEVYVIYTFNAAYIARTYLISSANDDIPGFTNRSFYSWTLQGSTDKSTWVTLDKQVGVEYTANFQDKVFVFENETAYRYYKLIVDQNRAGGTGGRTGLVQASDWSLGTGSGPAILPPGETVPEFMSTNTLSPSVRWNARGSTGFNGTRALAVGGEHTKDGAVYAKNKIYEFEAGEEIDVVSTTQLSYMIAPSFNVVSNAPNPEYPNYPSQHVALDLRFTDGTYLSELQCYDSHGVKLDPQSQFEGRCIWEGQWNKVIANIGVVAAGKKIDQILVSYANKNGKQGTTFEAFLDDVRIVGKRSDDPSAVDFSDAFDSNGNIVHPSVLTETRRGTMSSTSFSRGLLPTNVNMPFGFNFWGPQTKDNNANTDIYAYLTHNNANNLPIMRSFSINHQPSLWIADRGNFNTMASREANASTNATRGSRNYTFRHENEEAHAYYYGVTLDNGMRGEIAPTDHGAAIRWTFPAGSPGRHMLFDAHDSDGLGPAYVTWITSGSTLTGAWFRTDHKTQANGQRRMYVYVKFDTPATAWGTSSNIHYVSFGAGSGSITTYAASSYISWQQAQRSLELEIGDKNFDQVKIAGQKQWDDLLNTVKILDFAPDGWDGNVDSLPLKTLDELVTMYSNMYRSYSWPNAMHENTGTNELPVIKHASQYQGTTASPTIVDGVMYINNGFWDTYKSSWQAYGQLIPKKDAELLNGIVNHYIYNTYGYVPRWVAPGGHNSMVGTSSDVIFGTAAVRGIGFDLRRAYESAVRAASVLSPSLINGGRDNLTTNMFIGYTRDGSPPGGGHSWGMEGYINDFGVAQMADMLGYTDEAAYFTSRAVNYINYWNPYEVTDVFSGEIIPGGWLRAKQAPSASTGVASWSQKDEVFNPYAWDWGYTETNAWNMSFTLVDAMGMQNLLGGPDGMEKRLDGIFDNTQSYFQGGYGSVIHEIFEAAACKLGQYGHCNQPSHQLPFYYNFTNSPWKTQYYTRDIMDRLYTGWEIGQGFPGDEDNGEMSSWYVMTALGLSPTALGWNEFYLTAPYFSHMLVTRDDGTVWEIKAPGVSSKNRYIQSLRIDGEQYDKTYVNQEDLVGDGYVLFEYEMGDAPSKWGTDEHSMPHSLTAPGVTPQPLTDLTRGYTNRHLDGDEILVSTNATGTAHNLFNNNAGSTGTSANEKYVSTFTSGMYFGYRFAEPKVVHMYTISVGNTTNRNPRSWVFEASNDGVNWKTLDTRANVHFGGDTRSLGPVGTPITQQQIESQSGAWTHYTKPFGIKNTEAFTHYRIRVTSIVSGNTIEITELEFLGFAAPETAYTAFKGAYGDYRFSVINGVADEIGFMLPRKPVKPVSITLSSACLGIDNAAYTFTPDNWDVAQKLAVNPGKNRIDTEAAVWVSAVSDDPSYNCDFEIQATVLGDYSFTTVYSPDSLADAQGDEVNIKVTARNNNADPGDDINIFAALYSPDGKMVGIDRSVVTTPSQYESIETTLTIAIPDDAEDYILSVFYWDKDYVPLTSAYTILWQPPVVPPEPEINLALNKPVTASSSADNTKPEDAVDGNFGTRWTSSYSNNQWIIVDLQDIYEISRVDLFWEAAYSNNYHIDVSTTGTANNDFTTVFNNPSGQGGYESLTFDPVPARYVRLYCVGRATMWGSSVWEFEVYKK